MRERSALIPLSQNVKLQQLGNTQLALVSEPHAYTCILLYLRAQARGAVYGPNPVT